MYRTDSSFVRERLSKAGLWSKKSLGQHFLVDPQVLVDIVEAAEIQPNETVVEIGPGLGVLSEQLLDKTDNVIAFEFDRDMLAILAEDLPELRVISGDVLQSAPTALEGMGHYKVVANIPYQITTPLLRLFLESGRVPKPESLTLLVQKEVGRRLAAPAKHAERGYLSVVCQYYAEVLYLRDVQPTAFFPPPKVSSGVIQLRVRQERLLPLEEEMAFLRFVHTAFIQRRKQLKNVLAGIRGVEPAAMVKHLKSLGLPEMVRAQELTVEQWVELYHNRES